jgi:hypothetical protein
MGARHHLWRAPGAHPPAVGCSTTMHGHTASSRGQAEALARPGGNNTRGWPVRGGRRARGRERKAPWGPSRPRAGAGGARKAARD